VSNDIKIAVLETKFDNLERTVIEHMEREEEDREVLMGLISKQNESLLELRRELTQYRGFVGGVFWFGGTMFASAFAIWKFFF